MRTSLLKLRQFIQCQLFEDIDFNSISSINSGMRVNSMNIVRKQRHLNTAMKPIEIEIYPDTGPYLADGRHRLAVAKELGDQTIDAIVRSYDNDGNIIKTQKIKFDVNTKLNNI